MRSRKRPDITVEEKEKVAQFLLQNMKNGDLRRGTPKEAANIFEISIKSVRRIWGAAKQQMENGQVVHFLNNHRSQRHKDRLVPDVERIKAIALKDRGSIRKMAAKLEISKSLLGKWIKMKQLRAHTSAVKPLITDANKLARLKFSLSQLRCGDTSDENIKFNPMHNIVHIDEKWFFITKTSNRYYLLPEEADPYRTCKSKRFITKVMFLCAVSRPLIQSTGDVDFDGKIGIFPFTEVVPAQRNSKNRARGTMETKPIHSITKSVIKDCIINQVIPAIKRKWPTGASKEILIQQDNAKPHLKQDDPELIAAANSDGFHIKLICQPSNSPDTNINDLGFFRAIQSLQDDKAAKNVDELMENVTTSFEELTAATLNNVFLTLQGCFKEMMKERGGNNYKIPHMNKKRLISMGTLPQCIDVERSLVNDCLVYLMEPGNDAGCQYDLGPILNAFGY